MEDDMNELIEKVLTEITKDELVMALKIFEKMHQRKEEMLPNLHEISMKPTHKLEWDFFISK